jgi:hypothetical protein
MSGHIEVNPILVDATEYFRKFDPVRYRNVRREVLSYCRLLSALGLDDSGVERRYRIGPVLRYLAPKIALAAAGFPLFLWGVIGNFLPYKMPAWICRLVNLELVEVATVKFISGLVSFPAFYVMQTWLVTNWFEVQTALVYFISLPLTGLFALIYTEALTGFAEEARIFSLHLLRRDLMERLQKRRDRIVAELERGRDEYLASQEIP